MDIGAIAIALGSAVGSVIAQAVAYGGLREKVSQHKEAIAKLAADSETFVNHQTLNLIVEPLKEMLKEVKVEFKEMKELLQKIFERRHDYGDEET